MFMIPMLIFTAVMVLFGNNIGVRCGLTGFPSGPVYSGPFPHGKIAFLTGFIGNPGGHNPILLPQIDEQSKENPLHTWYFVSNDRGLCEFAQAHGYFAVLMQLDTDGMNLSAVEAEAFYARMSKDIKTNPLDIIGPDCDFVVYFDHKYNLRMDNVLSTLAHWEQSVDAEVGTVTAEKVVSELAASPTAVMLHERPACLENSSLCGADAEFAAAVLQPRYALFEEQMRIYIKEEEAKGFHVHGGRHFQTGFMLINMHHPDTPAILTLWKQHNQRAGILCQLSFYFVAQRYADTDVIREFTMDWNYGRLGLIQTFDDYVGVGEEVDILGVVAN
jgi:hypothetical protein